MNKEHRDTIERMIEAEMELLADALNDAAQARNHLNEANEREKSHQENIEALRAALTVVQH